jgi:hypothetical protein
MMQTVAEAMLQNRNLNSSPLSKSRGIQVGLLLVSLFLLGIVTLVAWALSALWFDFPFPALRRPLAAAFGLGAIAALAFLRRLDTYADARTSARGSNFAKRARKQKI